MKSRCENKVLLLALFFLECLGLENVGIFFLSFKEIFYGKISEIRDYSLGFKLKIRILGT